MSQVPGNKLSLRPVAGGLRLVPHPMPFTIPDSRSTLHGLLPCFATNQSMSDLDMLIFPGMFGN